MPAQPGGKPADTSPRGTQSAWQAAGQSRSDGGAAAAAVAVPGTGSMHMCARGMSEGTGGFLVGGWLQGADPHLQRGSGGTATTAALQASEALGGELPEFAAVVSDSATGMLLLGGANSCEPLTSPAGQSGAAQAARQTPAAPRPASAGRAASGRQQECVAHLSASKASGARTRRGSNAINGRRSPGTWAPAAQQALSPAACGIAPPLDFDDAFDGPSALLL